MSRITTIFIFTAVVLFNLSSGAQAADWNMWGKDAGHTFFTTDNVEPPLKVSWVFDLGNPSSLGSTSLYVPVPPVVSNNIVYTNGITVDGQNIQWWHFAIDADNGKLLWKYKAQDNFAMIATTGDFMVINDAMNVYAISNGTEKWRKEIIGKNSNPLIIYGNQVYLNEVYALSPENGSLMWRYEPELPGGDANYLVNNYFSPLVAGEDKVILVMESIKELKHGKNTEIPPEPPRNITITIIALNATEGKKEWDKRLSFSIEGPLIISNNEIFISGNSSVQGYSLENGNEIWRTAFRSTVRTVAAKNDTLFIDEPDGRNITALNTDSGQIIWTHQSSLDFPSYAISGNILYIAGSSNSSLLEALNATTGELIWRGIKIQGYNSASKPVISGDKLFLTAQDGKLYAFSHGTPGADEKLGLPMRSPSLGAAFSILVMLGAFMIFTRKK